MPNIRWCGELDRARLRERMSRAAIYAAPAHYEPFGLGILEAAAAGCALVLSDIESLRESWDGAALFVPSDDPERLRDALAQLCGNDVLRTGLQRAAAARAQRFTMERMVSGYLHLYEAMVAPGRDLAAAGEEALA
jgi:glycosyltransferase involved in cell wall biosynthesis